MTSLHSLGHFLWLFGTMTAVFISCGVAIFVARKAERERSAKRTRQAQRS